MIHLRAIGWDVGFYNAEDDCNAVSDTSRAPPQPTAIRECVVTTESPEIDRSDINLEQENESTRSDLFGPLMTAIKESKTVSFTSTPYTRWTSKDGQRTWLQAMNHSELAYQAPNLYRDTRFDREGNVSFVQIVDATNNKTLHLDMKSKQAMWMDRPINVYEPGHPLAGIGKLLGNDQLKFIGAREIDGVNVDVHRFIREPNQTSVDIWIDASAKRLVGMSTPGADTLDLADVLEGEELPPRKERGRGRMAGSIRSDIVIDPPVDKEFFSMVPPEGFELVEAPPSPRPKIVR